MFGTCLFLRATPRSDLSYQTIHLFSTHVEEDLLSQNLPRVATRREEFSLIFSSTNQISYCIDFPLWYFSAGKTYFEYISAGEYAKSDVVIISGNVCWGNLWCLFQQTKLYHIILISNFMIGQLYQDWGVFSNIIQRKNGSNINSVLIHT